MNNDNKIGWSLFLLRVSVFLVMLVWTIDKLINPGHAAAVFANFYGFNGLGATSLMVIAFAEFLLLLAFVGGLWKKYSYAMVLLLHAVSTLASFPQYLDPFKNQLFFAAWSMLAACITLYWLRDLDTKLTVAKK